MTNIYLFRLLNIPIPGNELFLNIVLLYSEILFIGLVILYIIVDCLFQICTNFIYYKTTYSIPFTSRMEDFLEIFFLYFSLVIVLYILIPSLGFLYTNEYSIDSIDYSFTLEVTGHQWYWSYKYKFPDTNIVFNYLFPYESIISYFSEMESFDSIMIESKKLRLLEVDRPLVIPSNTNIFTMITSTDVLHSWSVPQLGIKVDAVPGRASCINLYTFTDGIWYGQCSELCGANHAFMPIVVKSIPSDLFFSWRYRIISEYFHSL
jgi:heme/copper-type cytochrome/quinol oxidase subunit 2